MYLPKYVEECFKVCDIPFCSNLVVQAIARIMADKVYTSAEFKRERDNFHVSIQPSVNNSNQHDLNCMIDNNG